MGWAHRGEGLPCPVDFMWVEQGQCVPIPNTGQLVGGVDRTQVAAASELRVGVSTVCPGFGLPGDTCKLSPTAQEGLRVEAVSQSFWPL